jgi:probable rRNA maturation factor
LRSDARLPTTRLVGLLSQILERERRHGAIHLIVTRDPVMRRLNREFRGKNRPTDVLSFPLLGAQGNGTELIGEIYCSHDHCRRWSKENGGTVNDELLRLAAHGCLHLLGYDHHNPRDQKHMAAAENRYLLAAGLISARVGEGRA